MGGTDWKFPHLVLHNSVDNHFIRDGSHFFSSSSTTAFRLEDVCKSRNAPISRNQGITLSLMPGERGIHKTIITFS